MPSDKKISQLPEATSISPDDVYPIVQSGVTKKIKHSNVQGSYLQNANNLNDLDNVAAARSNLGVLSSSQTQSLVDTTFVEGFVLPGSPGVPSGTTYQNGFVAATPPLKVIISGYNQRHISFRGLVDCGGVTFPAGTFVHVFTLPSYARPTVVHYFPVVGLYAALGLCSVNPDGKVYVMNGMVGDLMDSGIVDFSNVNYYIIS